AELVRLVESGKIAPSRALDLGAGPGHDAIYLAKRGFRVLALDISPAALKLARANARKAGAAERIRFQVKDAAKLDVPPGSVAFANDRGCFHVLDASGRRAYLQGLARALAPEGILLLRVFSDKEPPGPGPRRFSKNELVGFFRSKFRVLKIKSGVFKGPRRPKAYVCLLRRLA
ncbi:MAG: class I SAM-dependent methyltransferase, partial [Elusimicrobia bacterium]|nr:class I SAM-dependent methyltransferase [Elusimicrobiota bacterium]